MRMEGQTHTDAHVNERAKCVAPIVERGRKVLDAVRETVREHPIVTIGGKNFEFSPEKNPGEVSIAKIQAIKGEVENLAEQAANDNDPSAEQAARLIKHALSGLEAFFGSLEDARTYDPVLGSFIDDLLREVGTSELDDVNQEGETQVSKAA